MESWRDIEGRQAGLITRPQLNAAGIRRWSVTHRVESEKWQQVSSRVIATTTGPLSPEQRLWAGVLHGGSGALLAGLSAAEHLGLRT